jgi:hypothetical protein
MERHRKILPHEVNIELFKARFNGKLPDIKGTKYKYPPSHDEEKWRCLLAKAYTHKRYELFCVKAGRKAKRNYKFEYILYHARPDQRQRRSKRNQDRKTMVLNGKVTRGRKQEVHHMDSVNLKKPVVLTVKQHDQIHSKKV